MDGAYIFLIIFVLCFGFFFLGVWVEDNFIFVPNRGKTVEDIVPDELYYVTVDGVEFSCTVPPKVDGDRVIIKHCDKTWGKNFSLAFETVQVGRNTAQ